MPFTYNLAHHYRYPRVVLSQGSIASHRLHSIYACRRPQACPARLFAARWRRKEFPMKTYPLLDNLTFRAQNPIAEPLSVDEQGRVLRFMLEPGQAMREH